MGYYSRHELSVVGDDTSGVISRLRDYSEDCRYAFDDDGNCEEECKGYDIDDDITKFSKSYPDVLFILNTEGEESGDIHVSYYKDGKGYDQKAVITFPPFDISKLR